MKKLLLVFLLFAVPAKADVILSDDFETGAASTSWSDVTLEPNWYVPDTAIPLYVDTPVHGGSYSIHYYAMAGTNEEGPFYLGLDMDPTEDELYVSWWEYFDGDYCWPTGSQKMLRIGNFSGGDNVRKDFTMVTRESGANVGYEYQCDRTGEGICDTGLGTNSEEIHPLDQWVHWALHIKLNTPSASDGFIKLYKNNVSFLSDLNLDLRGSDTTGFDKLWLGGNYSQEGGVGTLSCNGHRYLDDITIYDAEPAAEPTPTPTPGTTNGVTLLW